MTKQELKKNMKVWSAAAHRHLYYTGIELHKQGYNLKTKDYTPRHVYRFVDICDAIFDVEADDLKYLEVK